jgi:predicted nucleotidyltransferase
MHTKQAKSLRRSGTPDPSILANVVRRVVEAAASEKIVLFGSAARGTMGPESDLDLLVIKAGKFNRQRVTTAIYRNLAGEIGVDAVVVTPEDVERYRDADCLVICPALKEGKIVYDAKAAAAKRPARMAGAGEKPSRSRRSRPARR